MKNAKILLKEIIKLIPCKSLTSESLLEREIEYCFGADLMSDVLRFARTGSLLLTGLTNNQVLQVSEILDLKGIIFVRGKVPDKSIIEEAEKRKLPLLASDRLMFDTCGILYSKGLKGGKSLLEVKNESTNNIQPIVSD
jgi:predicted transcriptional regulator